MKEQLSRNIGLYRREKGLTQEELAQSVGVTYQAVSKWENAQTMPELALLPDLSRTLGVSIDKLLGYVSQDKPMTIYEEEYQTDSYYWGTEPNEACYQVLQAMPPTKRLRLIDIGCGEGKDAVFFARNGYAVTAFDITDAGVEKTRRLAERVGVHVDVFKADILQYRFEEPYDIVFSSGVLHYMKPELREEIFANYKRYTAPNGLHVFNVFVNKPFIAPPPEKEPHAYKWHSGELLAHYRDWLIEDSAELVFDCHSSGVPHQHAMATVMARKVEGTALVGSNRH
ncbi:methyltransferase domain-containing protein [Paenibacillus sp. YYML68]|uniref:methyltransferase domain-containing protein n=1 Tax=Paenibacillus sp. YYML68 TaxID=2909250 RepID=UPI002491EAC2|nr:methyltransferase domain-containing protein [Paenibacillus sp. YYML68]